MSEPERLTRDQRREIAREQARAEREARQKKERRNKILFRGGVTLAVLGILAAVGFGIWASSRGSGPSPLNMASGGIVFTGVDGEVTPVETDRAESAEDAEPTDTDDLDAEAHVVTYLDYLCPFCKQFEAANGAFLQELVASGDISLEVQPVAILDRLSLGTEYSTRSASAAGCVAEHQPESFLDFNAALFAAQPPENSEGLTNDEIVEVAASSGADSEEVASCIRDVRFKGWFTSHSERVTDDEDLQNPASGSFGTPTILVNGERYEGSITDPSALAAFIEETADITLGGDEAPAE